MSRSWCGNVLWIWMKFPIESSMGLEVGLRKGCESVKKEDRMFNFKILKWINNAFAFLFIMIQISNSLRICFIGVIEISNYLIKWSHSLILLNDDDSEEKYSHSECVSIIIE